MTDWHNQSADQALLPDSFLWYLHPVQIRHPERLALIAILAISACSGPEPDVSTSPDESPPPSMTTASATPSLPPTASWAFGGQVFCEQVQKDRELFVPGLKVLDTAARADDAAIVLAAASFYRRALSAMTLASYVCTGGRYTDPKTVKTICDEAKKHNASFVVSAIELSDEARERLQNSQLAGELSSALDSLVDATSKYGIIVGSAHNCYPTN